jgi:hypothetical protein
VVYLSPKGGQMRNTLGDASDRRFGLLRCGLTILAGLGALAILIGADGQAYAKDAGVASVDSSLAVAPIQPASVPVAGPKVAKPYFIEFRSRSAQSYGHTFSVFGRLNAQGKIATMKVAGLHPISESPIPWMIGHLILVPSETGASDGDTEDQYVTARFRVVLTEAEYKKLTTFIKQLQDKSPVWHAVLYNCNAWVGDIAQFMGFKTPGSTLLMPEEYITSLRDLNIGRQDFAEMLGTPVKVPDAAALRAEAFRVGAQHERQAVDMPATAASKRTLTATVSKPSPTAQ